MAARVTKASPDAPIDEPTPVSSTPSEVIRAWIAFRTGQITYENEHAAHSPIGGGNVNRGERQKVIAVILDELNRFSGWLDAGTHQFTPPMSEEAKREWRFALDHGASVPEHILAQL